MRLTRVTGRTLWIKLVPDVEKKIGETEVQMSTKKRPTDLFHERGSERVVDRMKPSAAKRYYSRVFKEAKLKPGARSISPCRLARDGPFFIRDAIAKDTRSISSSITWSIYRSTSFEGLCLPIDSSNCKGTAIALICCGHPRRQFKIVVGHVPLNDDVRHHLQAAITIIVVIRRAPVVSTRVNSEM